MSVLIQYFSACKDKTFFLDTKKIYEKILSLVLKNVILHSFINQNIYGNDRK